MLKYQGVVNKNVDDVASHIVIDKYIKNKGQDLRFEVDPHPIEQLRIGIVITQKQVELEKN